MRTPRRVINPLWMLGKIPKAAGMAAAFSATLAARFRNKGIRAAWYYFRYYFNNLFASFCNCYFNTGRVECPCCGWQGHDFLPIDGGVFWVPRMVCPQCLAYDRHRAFRLFATRHEPGLPRTKGIILHFAPESYVADIFDTQEDTLYFTMDLDRDVLKEARGPAFQADILQLPLPDASIDAIICFHVLEHIRDDRAAARELFRVLAPKGAAYIMVPLNLALEKSQFFGEPNPDLYGHYWAPGRDYASHLDCFEQVVAVAPGEYLSPQEAFRYGAPPKEMIFVCRKQ